MVVTRRRGIVDRQLKLEMQSPVGASLLAIAVCQATSMLTDPSLSRAGSLPQLIGGVCRECVHHLAHQTVCKYQLYSRSEMEFSNSASSLSLHATNTSMYIGSM
ncbi:hypothetical protein FQ185_01730 [Pseudomonas sp. ANT_H12B]|nr:hypothetical protein FQ185_01730 [Pseudomonas sp. ANT_H12B]